MGKDIDKTRKHVFISGRVQGVGFRAFTRRLAHQYGIKGWVRNLHDGKVEAVLSGKKKNVVEMLKKLQKGPSLSRVDNVEERNEQFENQFSGFSIRY